MNPLRQAPDADAPPELVRLTFWGVRPRQVPAAVARMALDRRPLRATRGLRFGKLLGTGSGRTFTVRDSDPLHWGRLTAWQDAASAAAFEASAAGRAWHRIAVERLDVDLVPLASRGRWSRRRPFGAPTPTRWDGPVAAITRARLRPARAARFWRAVPPVSGELDRRPGLRLAIGIGEAPIGLQGTFSLWDSAAALTAFAYGSAAHRDVVRRTPLENWYAEELFARFAVLRVEGRFAGVSVSPPAPGRVGPIGGDAPARVIDRGSDEARPRLAP